MHAMQVPAYGSPEMLESVVSTQCWQEVSRAVSAAAVLWSPALSLLRLVDTSKLIRVCIGSHIREERTCRFCSATLPDWKTALAPLPAPEHNALLQNSEPEPVMVVTLGDQIHRVRSASYSNRPMAQRNVAVLHAAAFIHSVYCLYIQGYRVTLSYPGKSLQLRKSGHDMQLVKLLHAAHILTH
eukprot:1138171-Pelagomonas_calceolata.AAC.4